MNSKTVLSAAHCFQDGSVDGVSIMAGAIDVNEGQVIEIEEAIFNTDNPWDQTTMDNDIVILKLKEEINFGEGIAQAACLPGADFSPSAGTQCFVSGWGTESSGAEDLPDTLKWVRVLTVDSNECNTAYSAYGGITDNMICASDEGKDSCQGDSGGPFVCMDGDNAVITGVVSFGVGCADPSFPGVYAKVTSYLDWIKSNSDGTDGSNGTDGTDGTEGTNGTEGTDGTEGCYEADWKGDGYCDDDNNNEFCGFDGGDCCLDYDDWPDRDWFCNDCECKE